MKNKIKNRLRALLIEMAVHADPAFSFDPVFMSHPNLVGVRRNSVFNQWQFVAIAFSPRSDRFFLEVAISRRDSFPIDVIPLGPHSPPSNGTLRFRAAELWGRIKSGGWLIVERGKCPPTDLLLSPEGVYENAEAAMKDVTQRFRKWILPYLDDERAKLVEDRGR